MPEAEKIIQVLGLVPHDKEGGYFCETYRSKDLIPDSSLPSRYEGERSFLTAIYYLLRPETCSSLHRLHSDEIFHFYRGDPVTMLHLYPDGTSQVCTLGQDIFHGEHPQVMVPKGVWQGAFLREGGEYALLGTTVAPSFDFKDYETGDQEALLKQYPNQATLIKKLSRKS